MAKIYYDKDVKLTPLRKKTIGVIGYGNQGRAQALNIRDSGFEVVIGNRRDAYYRTAQEDGMEVFTIAETVKRSDILIIAIPDEIQEPIYHKHIQPHLRAGQVIDFASSYGIRFKSIVPPKDVDVIMMSPRAMGVSVRESFVAGKGLPGFIAVDQDVSGKARNTALALAKAVGCTRAGVLECTFDDEASVNLFGEQALWPIFTQALILSYEVLTEAGIPPEIVLLELYASGEASEIFGKMAFEGMFKQMKYHSPTSQYGTLTRAETLPNKEMKQRMRKVLRGIRNGEFSKEWAQEQARGYPQLDKLKKKVHKHPINKTEKKVAPLSSSVSNYSTN